MNPYNVNRKGQVTGSRDAIAGRARYAVPTLAEIGKENKT